MERPDRLLVVDDVSDNIHLVRAILAEENYLILEARNGQQALEIIPRELPDLILLDVMMPGMDGYEVTRRVRAMENIPFIPILLITAYDQPSAVRGLDLGADEFIRKPVEADELVARVRSLLRLKHSIAERDRIEKQRQDFVYRLTHDLRTPLVAADKMLELLQEGVLGEIPPEAKEALAVMSRSNRDLLEMVNKLLDIYRYESGSKTLNMQPIDLRELLEQVVSSLHPIAFSKHIDLSMHLPDRLPMLQGDRLELMRVFNNIIGNALKFTDRGSVQVTVAATERETVVSVIDTGPGIPLAEQKSLFQRFQQGKHHKQGSGLGLYLSHYIVTAHGGRITVQSTPGSGSCFSIHLPHACTPSLVRNSAG
ncbi:MAG: hybrid sensor histidine kinase/response regulator [Pseudanabaenaceae cyanobacterium SKYGB_i_bin29]|nr:hybrid sensor histidine kinase/response regulator [Pseudanabaenaceae cyanobacterium SKYG29]MDW8421618.1 hybrid sensor histidine kinase/response regulator [Pseudanabaenaceae cyanobacterium SKYGB_i_bin29]